MPDDAPDADTATGQRPTVDPIDQDRSPDAPAEAAPTAAGPAAGGTPSPAPPPSDGGLAQWARRAGGYAWLEMRLFELLGRWATTVPEPAAAAQLGTASRHHAWHAELWDEHLPSIPGLDAAALVAPAGGGIAAAVEDLVAAAPGSGVEALASAYRVLVPRLVAGYDRDLAAVSPVSDATFARTLRIVLADLVPDWIAGQRQLAVLLTDQDAVERAAAQTARLELLLAGAAAPGRDTGSG